MTLNEYQIEAHKLANYASELYPFLALAEETGEVCGKLAKKHRGDERYQDEESLKDMIVKELGDVLWLIQECCYVTGVSLEEVAQGKLEKLKDRVQRNVLLGDGDER